MGGDQHRQEVAQMFASVGGGETLSEVTELGGDRAREGGSGIHPYEGFRQWCTRVIGGSKPELGGGIWRDATELEWLGGTIVGLRTTFKGFGS